MLSSIMKPIISMDESLRLKDMGYLAIDPHVHTSYSYDVPDSKMTSPENVIAEQQRQGLLKIITDHDTMDAHKSLNRDDVIKGVEIKITPRKARRLGGISKSPLHTLHINVYDINTKQFQDLENIAMETKDLDQFIDYVRSNEIKYQYNHPFWHERGERMNWRAVPELAKHYFDVIELNAGRPKTLNDLALYIANEYNKGLTSSTDSHTGRPGRALVVAEGKDFDEMWDNIRNRHMHIVRNDMTALGVVEEAAYMIENIFDEKHQKNKVYAPDTGIGILDNIAKRVNKAGYNTMLGKLAYKGLSIFNNSLGERLAERMYVGKENDFGKNIAGSIMDIVYDPGKNYLKSPVTDYP